MIHHQNKNSEAKGLGRVAGSMRITAVPWGIAQLSGGAEELSNGSNNLVDNTNVRWLDLQPREGEPAKYELSINPRDTWSEKSIFEFHFDCDDPKNKKSQEGDLVLDLLSSGKHLEYGEINEQLVLGKNLYKVLDYLCDRGLVSRARSKNNPRRWVDFIEKYSHSDTITKGGEKKIHPPPLQRKKAKSEKSHNQDESRGVAKKVAVEEKSENQETMTNNLVLSPEPYCKNTPTIDEDERTKLLDFIFGIRNSSTISREHFSQITNNKSLSSMSNEQLLAVYEQLLELIE